MPKKVLSTSYKMESAEEPLIEEQQTSKYTVALACLGITIVAAGILSLVLYVEDMFSKKIWM